ncbi:hypothetical protein NPIL_522571 [Nephila pilipes]|uniref:Uncharacterized protein n=1 Tax=Nephila pilipes TaxID=299642 RepID=A0A8X6QF44_NEPPI|nr:hypothetical protein NPIL_522571 [Nephila pilipes]
MFATVSVVRAFCELYGSEHAANTGREADRVLPRPKPSATGSVWFQVPFTSDLECSVCCQYHCNSPRVEIRFPSQNLANAANTLSKIKAEAAGADVFKELPTPFGCFPSSDKCLKAFTENKKHEKLSKEVQTISILTRGHAVLPHKAELGIADCTSAHNLQT